MHKYHNYDANEFGVKNQMSVLTVSAQYFIHGPILLMVQRF